MSFQIGCSSVHCSRVPAFHVLQFLWLRRPWPLTSISINILYLVSWLDVAGTYYESAKRTFFWHSKAQRITAWKRTNILLRKRTLAQRLKCQVKGRCNTSVKIYVTICDERRHKTSSWKKPAWYTLQVLFHGKISRSGTVVSVRASQKYRLVSAVLASWLRLLVKFMHSTEEYLS